MTDNTNKPADNADDNSNKQDDVNNEDNKSIADYFKEFTKPKDVNNSQDDNSNNDEKQNLEKTEEEKKKQEEIELTNKKEEEDKLLKEEEEKKNIHNLSEEDFQKKLEESLSKKLEEKEKLESQKLKDAELKSYAEKLAQDKIEKAKKDAEEQEKKRADFNPVSVLNDKEKASLDKFSEEYSEVNEGIQLNNKMMNASIEKIIEERVAKGIQEYSDNLMQLFEPIYKSYHETRKLTESEKLKQAHPDLDLNNSEVVKDIESWIDTLAGSTKEATLRDISSDDSKAVIQAINAYKHARGIKPIEKQEEVDPLKEQKEALALKEKEIAQKVAELDAENKRLEKLRNLSGVSSKNTEIDNKSGEEKTVKDFFAEFANESAKKRK